MRIKLIASPRKIGRVSGPNGWLTARVISGSARLAITEQELISGEGLPLETTDGLISLQVGARDLFMCSSGGAGSEVEIIL